MISRRTVKSGLKRIVYGGLYHSGGLTLSMKMSPVFKKDSPLIILAYHRFVDDNSVYLDKGPVMHHPIQEFEKEIVYLRKHYDIICMDEAVNAIRSGQGFSRPSVVLTFDDGYLDNYTLAFPVLRKHNVPATIYLTTSLIGTSNKTWPDQIESALLETTSKQFAHPDLFGGRPLSIATKSEKEKACLAIGQALKRMPHGRRVRILQDVIDSLGCDGKCGARSRLMLNWDEVKEMEAHGITFGSHSHTHPILSKMPFEQAKEEILRSKNVIEDKLGQPVKHFAIPNGGKDDFTAELRAYCEEIGFESVATLIAGINKPRDRAVFDLRRIGAISPISTLAATIIRLSVRS